MDTYPIVACSQPVQNFWHGFAFWTILARTDSESQNGTTFKVSQKRRNDKKNHDTRLNSFYNNDLAIAHIALILIQLSACLQWNTHIFNDRFIRVFNVLSFAVQFFFWFVVFANVIIKLQSQSYTAKQWYSRISSNSKSNLKSNICCTGSFKFKLIEIGQMSSERVP